MDTPRHTSAHYRPSVIVYALLILVVLLFIGAILGRSLHTSGRVLNYSDCIQANGSVVQTSYPETCVTKDGARFTNPAQQHPCAKASWATTPQTCR